jgi:hypothetical protein
MIHRKFNKLKFRRTYIGGSKQRELEIFARVQGTKEDNSECDWFEYRRVLMQYCDDVLNVTLSWKYVFNFMRYGFLVLSFFISYLNPIYSIVTIILSIISLILFEIFKTRESRKISAYNFSLDIINQETGVELPKN